MCGFEQGQANDLYRRFVQFEKQHGDRDGIEEVIVSKRRFQYEEELKKNSHNYDAWFDYARLEETHGEADKASVRGRGWHNGECILCSGAIGQLTVKRSL